MPRGGYVSWPIFPREIKVNGDLFMGGGLVENNPSSIDSHIRIAFKASSADLALVRRCTKYQALASHLRARLYVYIHSEIWIVIIHWSCLDFHFLFRHQWPQCEGRERNVTMYMYCRHSDHLNDARTCVIGPRLRCRCIAGGQRTKDDLVVNAPGVTSHKHAASLGRINIHILAIGSKAGTWIIFRMLLMCSDDRINFNGSLVQSVGLSHINILSTWKHACQWLS